MHLQAQVDVTLPIRMTNKPPLGSIAAALHELEISQHQLTETPGSDSRRWQLGVLFMARGPRDLHCKTICGIW